MKDYGYIERVLSHISNKQKKEAVKSELYDHLDEKERFFSEIGYDENASADKTDEAMGDADIVGEQLDSVGKHIFKSKIFLNVFSCVSLILTISAYILLSRTDISYSFSSTAARFYYIISPLFSFCMFSIVFILGTINLLTGTKKKNIFSLIIGFIICETVIIIGPYHYIDLLYCLINKSSYIESFFMNTDIRLMPSSIISGYEIAAIILSVSIALIAALSLIIIIKTKQLRNSKNDLKIKKALIAITEIITLLWVVCALSVTGLVFSSKDEIYNKYYTEFTNIEKRIINHIDEFTGRDYITINKTVNNAVKASEIDFFHDTEDLTAPIWTNGCITISEYYYIKDYSEEYYSEGEVAPEEISLSIHCEIMNPFGFRQSQYDIYSSASGNSKSIKTAPLPAQIDFYSDKQGCNVSFGYGSGAYFPKSIIYDYNFDSEKFEKSSDSFSNFETKAEITYIQHEYLEEALKKYYGFDNIIIDIYGVYQSDRFSSLYKIDFSCSEYDNDNRNNIIDDSLFYYNNINKSEIYGASMIIEFGEDHAEIIHYYAPNKNEYNTFEELITTIEDYYNEESLKEIKKII